MTKRSPVAFPLPFQHHSRFTNSMTSSWRHSVVSVNCLTSQKPNIASIFRLLPSRFIVASVPSTMLKFRPIMPAPASPNPTRMRPAILEMVRRRRVVSKPSFRLSSISSEPRSRLRGFKLISRTSRSILSCRRTLSGRTWGREQGHDLLSRLARSLAS